MFGMKGSYVPEIYLTRQFQSDLDSLDKIVQKNVLNTIDQIQRDYRIPGLNSKKHTSISSRNIWRSRVNDNFRLLWEWWDGNIRLWRVGTHKMIDAITGIRSEPKALTKYFTRDEEDHSANELAGLHGDPDQPQPFKQVPDNILRLYGVPDEALQAVQALTDAEKVWDLPIPENVQMTLYDILSNPKWTLDDLLDSRQLLYRTTVDQLEGYCEGKIKQLLLNLNEEQESYVHIRATGPVLIKGVAGSGKTTIGLYRAHHLAELLAEQSRMLGEGASVLLLTYTTTLTKALQQLYHELYGEDLPYAITVESVKDWMIELLRSTGLQLSQADDGIRHSLVEDAKKEFFRNLSDPMTVSAAFGWLSQKNSQFFLDEFDMVIRARRIKTLKQYQAIKRIGRGSALSREGDRPVVWDIYQRYQQKLDENGLFDWADLARLVEKHCAPLPQYEVVIVDEAQDLPPSDLHLTSLLVNEYSGLRGLTLLADPAQSIYYRGIPWKEAGINIQGRTRILAKNYRNTRQILEAASCIVKSCDDLKNEEEFIPSLSSHRNGPVPLLVSYSSSNDSNTFLANEIIKLCQRGQYRPGDIAVLSRGKTLLTKYIDRFLSQQNIQCRYFRDNEFHVLGNEVKLITMHSAKGLEFPVVFIVGLDDRYMPSIRDDSDTKLEDELQERKLFYVSMTRAAERLYLLRPQRGRSRFIYDLDDSTVNQIEC